MTLFNIAIVSDTVCPWCYVGWTRLSSAITQHAKANPSDTFAVTWHPFQLNPDAPRGSGRSVEKRAYYQSKFGPQQAEMIFARLGQAGAENGIKFSFGGKTGNTLDSHRLIELARQKETTASTGANTATGAVPKGLQTRIVEELFADYFEKEQDITDRSVLAKAASRAGLDEAEIRTFLDGSQCASEVEKEANSARAEGIHGVPNFTINDTFVVEGGQEPAAFLRLFQRFKERESKA